MTKNVRREDWESLKPTVCGWGINDVNYKTNLNERINLDHEPVRYKLIWFCPYYRKWQNMVVRCHCLKYLSRQPTYSDVTICKEWQYLSNFINWVDSQPNKDWSENQLDKDLLTDNHKYYSPETCVFVSRKVNNLILDNPASRGEYMIGVSYHKPTGMFVAHCRNPLTSKAEALGYFSSEIDAHKAWKTKKHEHACMLASLEPDPRVVTILRTRYL